MPHDQNQDDPERARLTPDAHSGSGSSVTPLAEAAAAVFPRLDLTADDARRLAQGARLPLPGDLEAAGPIAAFAPDGTLVALVTAEPGYLRSLAVFAGES